MSSVSPSARKTTKATNEKEFEREMLGQIRLTVFSIQSAMRRYIGMSRARGILFHMMRPDQEMSQAEIQHQAPSRISHGARGCESGRYASYGANADAHPGECGAADY